MRLNIEHDNIKDIEIIEKAFWFVCKYFKIEKEDYKVNVIIEDIIDDNNGLLIDDMEERRFDVLLKKGRPLGKTIMTFIHELVHIKQFIKNNLTNLMDCTIPYLERWWEIEAFEMTPIITKAYIDVIK